MKTMPITHTSINKRIRKLTAYFLLELESFYPVCRAWQADYLSSITDGLPMIVRVYRLIVERFVNLEPVSLVNAALLLIF